jgi:hypothetical protein
MMKKFRVMLEGRNFLFNSDEGRKVMGFYTTRFVEAENPKEAENLSVELIKNDSKLKDSVLNERSDPPEIYLESIDELESFGGNSVPGNGYTFYPDEDE